MKITIITNYWLNSQGGGVREYTKNFVNALEERGIEISVIFREGKDEKNFKMPKNKVKFIWKAYKTLTKIKPDIILAQGGWFTEIPAILYKLHKPKTKIFILFHTHFDKRLPFYKRITYNTILNKFDKVGFVSKALEKNVREVAGLGIKRETFILYAGATVKQPSKEEIEEFKKIFNISKDKIVLLGQALTAFKSKAEGARILISATKILVEKGYPIVLILTREGKYSQMLKDFAKKINIEKNVIFTGNVKNPFVPLAVCDIYTHITLGEGGVSLSILEAMAMGKPIVATPIGGIPEAIENGKNGILVEPEPEKIAESLENLIKNEKLRKKLGENAKKTAEEKFTWEKTAETFLKLILEE